jgi:hypothetical protein
LNEVKGIVRRGMIVGEKAGGLSDRKVCGKWMRMELEGMWMVILIWSLVMVGEKGESWE